MGLYTDYGAGRDPVIKNQKNASVGVCSSSSCGKRTFVSKSAWFRKTRPRCPACGALLDPSEDLQESGQGFATKTKRPLVTQAPRCCVCYKGNNVTIDDGLPICDDPACQRAIELVVEKLCAPDGILLREARLHYFGGRKYVFTGFAKVKHGLDFEPVKIEFEA